MRLILFFFNFLIKFFAFIFFFYNFFKLHLAALLLVEKNLLIGFFGGRSKSLIVFSYFFLTLKGSNITIIFISNLFLTIGKELL